MVCRLAQQSGPWIRACAGMTGESAGMTGESAGMTGESGGGRRLGRVLFSYQVEGQRKTRASRFRTTVSTTLNKTIVTMGMKMLKLPLLMKMSPGSLPK